jgi:hypothetical protein
MIEFPMPRKNLCTMNFCFGIGRLKFRKWIALCLLCSIFSCQTEQNQRIDYVAMLQSAQDSIDLLNHLNDSLAAAKTQESSFVKLRSVRDIENRQFWRLDAEMPARTWENKWISENDVPFYRRPDSASIGKLWFQTQLKIIDPQEIQGRVKVELEGGYIGYVDRDKIYDFQVSDIAPWDHFFLVFRKPPSESKVGQFQIKACEMRTHQVIATHTLPTNSPHPKMILSDCALKNASRLFTIWETSSQAPRSTQFSFMGYGNSQFRNIISGYALQEGNEYRYQTTYFPQRKDNGRILMVPNGFFDSFNWQTGKLDNFEVPDSIQIPLDELVVQVTEKGRLLEEDSQTKSLHPNPDAKVWITTSEVEYFRWNGEKLVKK